MTSINIEEDHNSSVDKFLIKVYIYIVHMHIISLGVITLPRCKKRRCCRRFGKEIIYKPVAIPCTELQEIVIDLDEFEAMRLCDLEELDQTAAGQKMEVSRGTIQRLLNSGRKKLIEALMNSRVIRIQNSTEKFEEEEQ